MRRMHLLMPILLACFQGLTAQVTPTPPRLRAAASRSLESTFLLWVEDYRSRREAPAIDLEVVADAEAVKRLTEGYVQFAPLDREMTPPEIAAFTATWGYAPTRIAVALDALVILVAKENPIKSIRMEQLDAIWTSTRKQGWPTDILTWGEAGLKSGDWSRRPIVCVGRALGSGSHDFFLRAVTLGGRSKEGIRRADDATKLAETLQADPGAMGYGSLTEAFLSLRTVPVVPKGGATPVAAEVPNVSNGSYPLSRMLYIYVNKARGKALSPDLAGFLRYVLSPEGQNQVQMNGMVPLPKDLILLNLRRMDAS